MTLLPIVERELRVAARRRSTYWLRVVSVLLVGGSCIWYMGSTGVVWSDLRSGAIIFERIALAAFWVCLFLGVFTTADCLSSEKRRCTLGLLFLTDLRSHDVVLGKLAASSLTALYALAAVTPLLALPLLLGGVHLQQVSEAVLVLICTAFLSLTAGMLVSALCRTEAEATLGTFLGISLISFGVVAAAVMGDQLAGNHDSSMPAKLIQSVSPWIAIKAVMQTGTASTLNYCGMMMTILLMLKASCWVVQRSWREGWGEVQLKVKEDKASGTGSSIPPVPSLLGRVRQTLKVMARRNRSRFLDQNPMLWLSQRDPLRLYYVWVVIAVMLAVWIFTLWKVGRNIWMDWEVSAVVVLVTHGILKLLLAAEASRQIAEDRQTGALELLLTTPLNDRTIVGGHLLAMFRQFAGPVLFLLVFDALLLWLGHTWQRNGDTTARLFVSVSACMLVVDTVAISCFGIWAGLHARNASRATLYTVLLFLVLPWLMLQGVLAAAPYIPGVQEMFFNAEAYSVWGPGTFRPNAWGGVSLVRPTPVWQTRWIPDWTARWFFWLGMAVLMNLLISTLCWWIMKDSLRASAAKLRKETE